MSEVNQVNILTTWLLLSRVNKTKLPLGIVTAIVFFEINMFYESRLFFQQLFWPIQLIVCKNQQGCTNGVMLGLEEAEALSASEK